MPESRWSGKMLSNKRHLEAAHSCWEHLVVEGWRLAVREHQQVDRWQQVLIMLFLLCLYCDCHWYFWGLPDPGLSWAAACCHCICSFHTWEVHIWVQTQLERPSRTDHSFWNMTLVLPTVFISWMFIGGVFLGHNTFFPFQKKFLIAWFLMNAHDSIRSRTQVCLTNIFFWPATFFQVFTILNNGTHVLKFDTFYNFVYIFKFLKVNS